MWSICQFNLFRWLYRDARRSQLILLASKVNSSHVTLLQEDRPRRLLPKSPKNTL